MAGRKAGTPRSDRTRNAKQRLPGDEPVLALPPGPEPWAPTAEQAEHIKSLAGRGVGEREIAHLIGVDRVTLKLRAADLLEQGRALGIATITGSVFSKAKAGSYAHAALYLAQVAKWSTRQTNEQVGEGGGPVQYTILTGVPQPGEPDPEGDA